MPPLPTDLRKQLENTIPRVRTEAEDAARAVLTTLAVDRPEPFASLSAGQRRLRNALRARARQLGGGSLTEGLEPLAEDIAYQQWHRMLFARFLAENGLLMHPSGVAVTLQDCAGLAVEEGDPDAWSAAARYASGMLPGIFRRDDPAVQVRYAPEGLQALERRLESFPPQVFTADDSLGWMYQFWQSQKKKQINASERKIGGADLAPVTQLFTEDYMVRFLLENSLGAWWAARHPDSPLIREWEYLRWAEEAALTPGPSPEAGEGGRIPAAGTFPGWPERAAEVTMLDPCCGSGHILGRGFHMLRQMRMEEEGLSAAEAGDAVLRDNLFGLEIDPRCTQIAAFALALEAWKSGGYRPLPAPNVACSGIPVLGQLDDWLKLARGDQRLENALERLYTLFKNAPELGSLINPADLPIHERMFTADYERVAPLLQQALAKEQARDDPVATIFGVAAEGLVKAAQLLAGKYSLVTTNVPYLARGKQSEVLKLFGEKRYPDAKADLATVFLERCIEFCSQGGSITLVSPQNWQFLVTYKRLRTRLLLTKTWLFVAGLGPRAFETIGGHVVNVALFVLTNIEPLPTHKVCGVDVGKLPSPSEKKYRIKKASLKSVLQLAQLKNPDSRVTLENLDQGTLLEKYASCFAGILNGDSPKFQRLFWEIVERGNFWALQQSTVIQTEYYGGREKLVLFDEVEGHLREDPEIRRERLHDSDQRGNRAWGKKGVAVSQIGSFPVTLYTGEKFDSNVAVIFPKDQTLVPAIWAFCSSPEFHASVRRIDQKLNATNATLVKVPFDLDRWQKVAEEAGPLPEPHSNDPTQWLFKGQPAGSAAPLQVAVARLLGYRWPQQEADDLDGLADADGLVPLSPLAHEAPAAERLRAALAAAYGPDWSPARQVSLLAEAGFSGRSLEEWLRDAFFEQHCRLFHNRPFIWHIWDGRKDGFSILANYHRLDGARLDKLIYTYLGAWIQQQRARRDSGEAGADGRLVAALELQEKLKLIRQGEPPYDIYVRWKPLHQQPVGWEPDLNDGLRLNIRPFVTAKVLRAKFTINWNKDRGKNPDGSERVNDRHLTIAEKRAARAEQEGERR